MIEGLAQSRQLADFLFDVAGAVATRVLRKRYWERDAPTVWPLLSYAEIRAMAKRLFTGVRYRRHMLCRHSLIWTRAKDR